MSYLELYDEPGTSKKLHLPDVELIVVDCVDVKRAERVIQHSTALVDFGLTTLLTSLPSNRDDRIEIPNLACIEDYSDFMVRMLSGYISLPYILISQYDGFVLDPGMWSDDFYEYDYIGAPWNHDFLDDGIPKHYSVGNGGFSFRSKKLHEYLAECPDLIHHPYEDVTICKLNRGLLEREGFKFAPYEVALRFSGETGAYVPAFGQHGRMLLMDKYRIHQEHPEGFI